MKILSQRLTAAAAYSAGYALYPSSATVATLPVDADTANKCIGVLASSVAAGDEVQLATGDGVTCVAGGAVAIGDYCYPNAAGKVLGATIAELQTAGRQQLVFGQARSVASGDNALVLVDIYPFIFTPEAP